MNEKQLQAKIVMDFSQKMFDYQGCLWSTRNTTFSVKDGQTQKAMGMVAGVSDLILFMDGRFVGIEVKVKGSTHNTSHVAKQVRWGENISFHGGEWYIVTSLDEFWDVVNKKTPEYTIENVLEHMAYSGSKIKF